MERDWKPVRSGRIYCSPACGGKCTRPAYNNAMKRAKALAKKCAKQVGGKWLIDVWENLGWHYRVALKDGDLTISEHVYKGKKTTYSISGFGSGTPVQVSTRAHSKSIKNIVETQLTIIRQEAKKWNFYLVRNSKALKIK